MSKCGDKLDNFFSNKVLPTSGQPGGLNQQYLELKSNLGDKHCPALQALYIKTQLL